LATLAVVGSAPMLSAPKKKNSWGMCLGNVAVRRSRNVQSTSMVALSPTTNETPAWAVLDAFPKPHSRVATLKTKRCTEVEQPKSLDRIEIWLTIYDDCAGLESFTRDPIRFYGGDENIYRFAIGNVLIGLDPMGLEQPWNGYPGPRILPPTIDPRPQKSWLPYSSYNCAGYALRTYEYEGDKKTLLKKLSPYESQCDKDCKCGETKCRVWDFVLRMYDANTGKFVIEMDQDFHMECSRIPKQGGNETGPEPLCYQKNGSGPVTDPIDPSKGAPGPESVPNVPKTLVAKLEDMKQYCYCLPAGGIK
jgi:hypothetical protein